MDDNSEISLEPLSLLVNWEYVLNYMPYDEVRHFLQVRKSISQVATKNVTTLNITSGCQMDVPSSTFLFPNIESINIVCLFSSDNPDHRHLSRDTVFRIVPFLLGFPKLKKLYIGGRKNGMEDINDPAGCCYHPLHCEGPENHKSLFDGLINSVLGSMKTRGLSTVLEEIIGFHHVINDNNNCQTFPFFSMTSNKMCQRCREICLYFPWNMVVHERFNPCLTDFQKYLIVLYDRKIFVDKKQMHKMMFSKWIESELKYRQVSSYSREGEIFHQKMQNLNKFPEHDSMYIDVKFITTDGFSTLDAYLSLGLNPNDVIYEHCEFGRGIISNDDIYVWMKSTFDGLLARGFPMNIKFILVDEYNEIVSHQI